MDQNLATIITSLIAVLFGGGAWKFYEFLVKKRSGDKKSIRTEQTMYRDDLISRVERLERDKDNCSDKLMDLSQKLSALTVELAFIKKENERLKYK
tara:strand:+ start:1534 stop:1821 length:288 start_codon:yes stop_codon:yes gene_type:complete